MITLRTFSEVRGSTSGRVALVPTMGCLHEGHLSLISAASGAADTTVVSLFVNPSQFGKPSDLDAYPRDEDRDAALADKVGADILFVPSFDEVYPSMSTTVTVAGAGEAMEGRFRPGHFEGVATVVAKLFGGVQPDVAVFGKKDAQQLAVVRTMTSDLHLPVRVLGMPTVREAGGLALSSRNTHLRVRDRDAARSLSEALFAAADVFDSGNHDVGSLKAAAEAVFRRYPDVDVEYIEMADVDTARPVAYIRNEAFLAVAARVGGVRLIDNVSFDMETRTVDRGIVLDSSSILYEED